MDSGRYPLRGLASQLQAMRDGLRTRLRGWQELRFARRVCAEVLRAHERVRARHPGLSGTPLYEAVISERLGVDAAHARRVLQDAHASREDWDNEREPLLRDLVLYCIVSEYLREGGGHRDMELDLRRFLDQNVPPGA